MVKRFSVGALNGSRKWASLALLLLSVAFICYGAWRGEVDTVFSKAVRLCMECVGIG